MNPEAGLKLRVGNPVHRDVLMGRCRLHPTTMAELGLSPGAPVTVTTDQGTVAAYAYPTDYGDWELPDPDVNAVYIGLDFFFGEKDDPFLEESDNLFLGEGEASVGTKEAVVRPVSPSAAEHLIYELSPRTSSEIDTLVSENIVDKLALAGTRMPIYKEEGSAIHSLSLKVHETTPEDVVVVTTETKLEPRTMDE